MKSNFKKIFLVLLVIGIISTSFGCAPKIEPKEEEKISVNLGFLKGKNASDNSIVMKFDNEEYMIKVEDKELFNSLIQDELYLVAYNENNILKSIEANSNLKELVLNSKEESPIEEVEVVEISPIDKVSLDNLTLLGELIFDFDKDRVDEKISMYTAAGRDSNGEIMWDDGQRWLVVVHDEDKDYVLFDGWVQLGGITPFAYTVDEDFYIATISTGTANLTFKSYKYDKSNDKFIMTIPFDAEGNVNLFHIGQY